jgi:hypothetical protein
MVSHQVETRRRDEGGELLQQLQRFEAEVGRPVAPAVPGFIHHPAVRKQ